MTKPACVPCGRFFKPEKNGELVAENKPIGGAWIPPGKDAPGWIGYKVYRADKWKCHGCGTEIIVGWGGVITQDYMPDFQFIHRQTKIVINDC